MNLKEILLLLVTLLGTFPHLLIITFSGIAAIGGALLAIGGALLPGLLAGYSHNSCQFQECCTDKWIGLNGTELTITLEKKVYGQHLANKAVLRHIKAHFKSENPSKALALSLHGGTGTGKNYISKIIAEHIYKKGLKSKFVHVLLSTTLFSHEAMLPLYKVYKNDIKYNMVPSPYISKIIADHFYKRDQRDKLRQFIEQSTAQCRRSLFIFDKVDGMPPGLIDTVKPYLDFYEQLDGIDFRKAIFIFLSNTGGTEISKHTISQWRAGLKREDIKLREMKRVMSNAAINTEGGLWHHNHELNRHMITAHIPFLPLERRHVRRCVRNTLLEKKIYKSAKHIDEDKVQEVLNELLYYPKDEQLFSVTGCKRVPEKVDYRKQC